MDDRQIVNQIGRNIREARELEGLTINEVAERAGIMPGFWNRVECGLALPSIPVVVLMAQALNWNFHDLLNGIDATKPRGREEKKR